MKKQQMDVHIEAGVEYEYTGRTRYNEEERSSFRGLYLIKGSESE